MAKIVCLHDAFSECFKPEASPVEGQSLQQKEKRRRKRKGKRNNKIIEKPKDVGHFLVQNFDFCACLSKNVIKRDASGKKGMLSCCNAFLSRLELIWPISSLKISRMSKNVFLAKSSRSQWVKTSCLQGAALQHEVAKGLESLSCMDL